MYVCTPATAARLHGSRDGVHGRTCTLAWLQHGNPGAHLGAISRGGVVELTRRVCVKTWALVGWEAVDDGRERITSGLCSVPFILSPRRLSNADAGAKVPLWCGGTASVAAEWPWMHGPRAWHLAWSIGRRTPRTWTRGRRRGRLDRRLDFRGRSAAARTIAFGFPLCILGPRCPQRAIDRARPRSSTRRMAHSCWSYTSRWTAGVGRPGCGHSCWSTLCDLERVRRSAAPEAVSACMRTEPYLLARNIERRLERTHTLVSSLRIQLIMAFAVSRRPPTCFCTDQLVLVVGWNSEKQPRGHRRNAAWWVRSRTVKTAAALGARLPWRLQVDQLRAWVIRRAPERRCCAPQGSRWTCSLTGP